MYAQLEAREGARRAAAASRLLQARWRGRQFRIELREMAALHAASQAERHEAAVGIQASARRRLALSRGEAARRRAESDAAARASAAAAAEKEERRRSLEAEAARKAAATEGAEAARAAVASMLGGGGGLADPALVRRLQRVEALPVRLHANEPRLSH